VSPNRRKNGPMLCDAGVVTSEDDCE
jgi:hypothetical protein